MKRSEQRILTTHIGSLPRPPALRDLLVRLDRGEAVDAAALAREAEAAVRHVVRKQIEAGIDVGNDGEQPRVGFSTYPAKRMQGFGGASKRRMSRDIAEHPDYMARLARMRTGAARINDAPQAVAEVAYTDLSEAVAECELYQRCAGAERRVRRAVHDGGLPGRHRHHHARRLLRLARALHPGPRARDAQGVRADRRARASSSSSTAPISPWSASASSRTSPSTASSPPSRSTSTPSTRRW